jgi:hypothetical protein
MEPNLGVAGRGTVVTLSGRNFIAGSTLCWWATKPTLADVLSSTEARCQVPEILGIGRHGLALTNVADDMTVDDALLYSPETAQLFTSTPALLAARVSPSQGATQGSVISIFASHEEGEFMTVQIGTVSVQGTSLGSAVQCILPGSAAGNYSVQVSANNQDWTIANGILLEAVDRMNVTMVEPAVVVGGSEVSVVGAGFSAAHGLYCGVGGSSLQGTSWSHSVASW